VFTKLVKNETLTKGDKSPVTVGDYSAQAVVNTILSRTFPVDPIVGEEDAAELRQETGGALKDRVVALANEALTADLGMGESAEWGLGPGQERTPEELLDAIDRGSDQGGRIGRRWTLDPIDGIFAWWTVCGVFGVDRGWTSRPRPPWLSEFAAEE
jgi:3'(2'), 5'-bisphosphate nucleotidase